MTDLRAHWGLDPAVVFLNHGSFGACPKAVLAAQHRWRERMEAEPVTFFLRDLPELLEKARGELAGFLGAMPEDLVFVSNATAGVNTVLRSLDLVSGDELLVTDHAYGACRNAVEFAAGAAGARVVVACVPFPLAADEDVVEAVLAAVGDRTRLALLDHVTSPTGLVFPIARLVRALADRGIDTLVDGAHAPGMVDVDLRALGAAYYTGNCHKWLCAPKGAGFLVVRPDRQARVRPLVISHGASARRPDRSRYLLEFDWTGTDDPTPYLCVPEAIRYMASLLHGGWVAVRECNHALALEARSILVHALGAEAPCPASMIGSLVSIPIGDGTGEQLRWGLDLDSAQDALLARFGIEVPIVPWPAPPRRLVRASAQLYNARADYERLAHALVSL